MNIKNENTTIITLNDQEVFELSDFLMSLPAECNDHPFFETAEKLMGCLSESRPIINNQ